MCVCVCVIADDDEAKKFDVGALLQLCWNGRSTVKKRVKGARAGERASEGGCARISKCNFDTYCNWFHSRDLASSNKEPTALQWRRVSVLSSVDAVPVWVVASE